jgi:amidase
MELSDYVRCDATELKGLLDAGEVSADEVCETALRAIEEVEPQINSIVHGPFEEPVPHDPAGPFAGVPFALKDLVCAVAGYPLEFGSRMFEGNVAEADTTLGERFKAAGLVTLAKTATPEFGINANAAPVVHGPTRNPWDTERIPGGSSGGSAALVAARGLPMAHANDGGGSIRIPASWCGLVGLKPTRGRVPIGPEVGEALAGFAAELAVTRSVRDTAALLDAVCGPAPGDKYYVARPDTPYADDVGADPGRLRIALHTESFYGEPTEPEVVAAVESVARALEGMGHTVEPAAPEFDIDALRLANITIWTAFTAALAYGLGAQMGREPREDNLETATWAVVQHGARVSAMELTMAELTQNAITRVWGAFLDEYDVFLCPTLPVPALPLGSLDQNDPKHTTAESWFDEVFPYLPYTPLFNVTGQPSISLPLGTSSEGLPIGVMLSAQSLREDLLIRVAAQLEEAVPWADRVPAVCAGAPAPA